MKKSFTAMFLIAMAVLASAPSQSFAQSGTLVIYAGGTEKRTIDQIISADTLSGGAQVHSVYQLVSLDTTYLLDATITIKSNVSIVGVPGTNGQLPCIQADLVGPTITGIFFTFNGKGTRVNLQNLYLLGVAPNNANNTSAGQGVQVSADNISLTVSNCVFDNISQFEIAYSANGDNFYINNSKFRNGIDVASAYYVPELLRSLNGAGSWSTDTIDIVYNTMIGVAMGPVETTGLTTYMNFSHNDVILTSKGPFWSEREVNLVFDNNIFYNTYAVGETHTEYAGGWDEIKPPRIPSVFYLCALDSATGAKLIGHAIATSADSAAAEAARHIEVKNNDCYWSSGLTTFWSQWNDTATTAGDSLYTPVFMNSQTMAMFSNTTAYPNLVQSGNVSVNPTFGASIDAVLSPGSDTTDGVGLLAWIAAVRGGKGTTQWYAYKRTEIPQPQPGNWVPTWPLPEASDLAYTNSTLKSSSTDGKPLGDPYWFTGITAVKSLPESIPAKFELNNNYPNPFNPSTDISFTVDKNGPASLKIYNLLGQLVLTVYEGNAQAHQKYNFNVNMDRFASGVYFYSLQQASNSITKKLLLLK